MSQINDFMGRFPKVLEKIGLISDKPVRADNGQYLWHERQVTKVETITRGRVLIRVVGTDSKYEPVIAVKPPFEKRSDSWWYEAITLPNDKNFERVEYSLADAGLFPFNNNWSLNCLLDTGIALNESWILELESIALPLIKERVLTLTVPQDNETDILT